jgi:F0F1-type ATP synthase assembly protein I
MATVIGYIIGPLIGSILDTFLGTMHTFFIFGSFLVFLSIIIKMNFNGDAEVDFSSDCDDSYYGDNQYRYADELSSFQNDVTP